MAENQPIPIVDTHQHLWDLDKIRLPWLASEGAAPIRHSYVTADYLEATKGLGVTKAVYMEVNAHPDDYDKEAAYVLDLCRRDDNPTVAAVIGGAPQSAGFKDYIVKYADNRHVKGVRTILHDADRPAGMCLERQFVENIQLLGDLGLIFDLCLRPAEIGDGVKLVDQCSKTRFVVDHCGNMPVDSDDADLRNKWETGMREMAARENTVCKISGIIVTADKETWQPTDLAENINYCLDTFGDDRVMFAGDWPVCTLTAPYADWLAALQTIVKDRPETFRRKLFHDNAEKFYALSDTH